ncbi:MAG: hypothetical protein J1G02_06375 [Clostridiales bacterium]|nr:hypothetical protein [Clostridiales bacterium]
MITQTIVNLSTNEDITESVQQPITINQRLDRELDSGYFDYRKCDKECEDRITTPLSGFRITLSDGDKEDMVADFIGTDQRTLLRGKFGSDKTGHTAPLFRHNVNLTEPTKLLEGTLIDGFAVTQPDENKNTQGKSTTEYLTFGSFDRVEEYATISFGYKTIKTESALKSVSVQIRSSNVATVSSGVRFQEGDDFFEVYVGYTTKPAYIELSYTYEELFKSQSLKEVVDRLLKVSSLCQTGEEQRFVFNPNSSLDLLLKNTISPQFKWSTQTTLWECLCDIGSVIDAIPRLKANGSKFVYVDFDLVNDSSQKVTQMLDEFAIDYGEEVDESQYNTQLRSVVENIKEE